MSEERLQMNIARRFSELYPEKRGQLFHVSNERSNKIKAFKARAIGIIAGVADFVYFSKEFNVATELKLPESRHSVISIINQVYWGEVWEKQGGIWRLCTTVEEAINCYEGNFQGYTIKDMKKMLKNIKTKTIKIEQWDIEKK